MMFCKIGRILQFTHSKILVFVIIRFLLILIKLLKLNLKIYATIIRISSKV